VKFRRRKDSSGDDADDTEATSELGGLNAGEPDQDVAAGRGRGPYDVREVSDADGVPRVDLGGLLVVTPEGVELRLQADQATGAVSSVLLATEGAGLELRPFAAPKSGGLWDEVRREIVAEAAKQGGTATETEGEHGHELRLQVPVRTPDGRNALQVSRVVGVEGPRWFLRGTFLGTAASEPDPDGPLELAFRELVVVRGQMAMPPRDALPLRLPHDARLPVEEQATPEDGPPA